MAKPTKDIKFHKAAESDIETSQIIALENSTI